MRQSVFPNSSSLLHKNNFLSVVTVEHYSHSWCLCWVDHKEFSSLYWRNRDFCLSKMTLAYSVIIHKASPYIPSIEKSRICQHYRVFFEQRIDYIKNSQETDLM